LNTSPQLAQLAETFRQCRDLDASLTDRLRAYSEAVERLLPEYAGAVDELVRRLASNGVGEDAPKAGEAMPPFIMSDETGRLISLAMLLRGGPVAVTFHRGHWCPWCRISVNALARAHSEITREGGQVVAIMPDRQKFAAAFKAEANSPFPVLTDVDNGYAMSINLAIWVGEDLQRLLVSYGRSLPDYQGNDAWILPVPATFVVGRDGIVRARFVDPDFRHRVAVDDLLAALRDAS
jgi:peroxiredoxin